LLIAKTVTAAALASAALFGFTASPSPATKPSAPPVVNIVARDFAFDPIPDAPSGIVEIRLRNEGPSIHHAAIYKLLAGKSADELIAALKNPGPPPSWAVPVAGPNAPAPKEYSNVTTRLTPGNYTVLCFVSAGGSPPHFMKGMFRGFKVVAAKNTAVEPKTDLTVTTFDYGFKLSKAPTAGAHTVLITNAGKQQHELELIQLAPGKTVAQMLAWIDSDMKTPPPGKPMAGIVGILPGGHASFDVTLTPGEWGVICFVPDMLDGKPHFMHGMITQFTVK
jgi:hypothetical protein